MGIIYLLYQTFLKLLKMKPIMHMYNNQYKNNLLNMRTKDFITVKKCQKVVKWLWHDGHKGRALENLFIISHHMWASINYVDGILRIFDPLPLRWQVYLISLFSIVDIWETPSLPLACQRSLWMTPKFTFCSF